MIPRLVLVALLTLPTIVRAQAPTTLVVESPDALAVARRIEAELGALGLVSERVTDDGSPLAALAVVHGRRALIRAHADAIEIWLADGAGAVVLQETMPVADDDATAPLRAVERLRAAAWEPAEPPPEPPSVPVDVVAPEPPPPAREIARVALFGVARFGEGLDGPVAHVAVEGTACVHLAAPCDLSVGAVLLAPAMPVHWVTDAGVVSVAIFGVALSAAYTFDLAPVRVGPRLSLGAIVYALDAAPIPPYRSVVEVRVGFDATLGATAAIALAPTVALRIDADAEVAFPLLEAFAGARRVAQLGPWGGRVAIGVEVSIR